MNATLENCEVEEVSFMSIDKCLFLNKMPRVKHEVVIHEVVILNLVGPK